ncbi:glycosyl hydrolase [Amycolatopsis taiwanensis]|uniref:Glycosyl hydrolase n=2 Tax=Amycolatopsis taiwanensis TaxID=342230 RepID=A0A9W6R7Z9_9PSEU|nr:glycosyl hydrolase [Amycolatopsis taiwanensis]
MNGGMAADSYTATECVVDVVLPCLDEAAALPSVLEALPDGFRPVVVDNGSRDGSPEIATAHGARVVHETRRGYGAAVHTGIEAASTDVVCVLDADGSLDPAELPRVVEPVRLGSADLVVGRRLPVSRDAWPWHGRAGNAVLAALLRHGGLPVHDIGPVRAFRRAELLDLGITDRGFGYPLELLVRAAAANWRVIELDVSYRRRAKGTTSKVSGSVRGTARAIRDMAAVWRRVGGDTKVTAGKRP